MPSQAKVKAVLSGDTIVLVSLNNPGEEKTLSLAYVSAPRMRREGDEVSYARSTDFKTITPSDCVAICLSFSGIFTRGHHRQSCAIYDPVHYPYGHKARVRNHLD